MSKCKVNKVPTQKNGSAPNHGGSLQWPEIEARVLEAFTADDSPCARNAIAEWKKQVTSVRNAGMAGEKAHAFTAPEVIEALVAFFRADVAANLAINQLHLAKNRRTASLARLPAALGEFDGFLCDSGAGHRIVPELGIVERRDPAAELRVLRGVVNASRAAASGDETHFPSTSGVNVAEFEKDLRAFLAQHAEQGRDFVLSLCNDVRLAEAVRTDEGMPAPIRFLAGLVIQTTPAPLTKSQPAMGFTHS